MGSRRGNKAFPAIPHHRTFDALAQFPRRTFWGGLYRPVPDGFCSVSYHLADLLLLFGIIFIDVTDGIGDDRTHVDLDCEHPAHGLTSCVVST